MMAKTIHIITFILLQLLQLGAVEACTKKCCCCSGLVPGIAIGGKATTTRRTSTSTSTLTATTPANTESTATRVTTGITAPITTQTGTMTTTPAVTATTATAIATTSTTTAATTTQTTGTSTVTSTQKTTQTPAESTSTIMTTTAATTEGTSTMMTTETSTETAPTTATTTPTDTATGSGGNTGETVTELSTTPETEPSTTSAEGTTTTTDICGRTTVNTANRYSTDWTYYVVETQHFDSPPSADCACWLNGHGMLAEIMNDAQATSAKDTVTKDGYDSYYYWVGLVWSGAAWVSMTTSESTRMGETLVTGILDGTCMQYGRREQTFYSFACTCDDYYRTHALCQKLND